jgi:catechol 2,3-dioxygenase-like lactoylglutathione lyase family enzyme
MLEKYDAEPMIAVKDLKVARRFYEQTLGLPVTGSEGDDYFEVKLGKMPFSVYRSDYAGTNKATALSWDVGEELPSLVQELRKKDVSFLHYDDLPDTKREGDLHFCGDMKLAWFRDPDGNILGLMGK